MSPKTFIAQLVPRGSHRCGARENNLSFGTKNSMMRNHFNFTNKRNPLLNACQVNGHFAEIKDDG